MKTICLIAITVFVGMTEVDSKAQETNSATRTNAPSQEDADKLVIKMALFRVHQARTNCVSIEQSQRGHRVLVYDGNKYVANLKKVDVSKCPKDFRIAWVDYMQAWERKVEAGVHGKLIILAEGVEAAMQPGAGKLAEDAVKRAKAYDTSEPWRAVEKLTVISGLKPLTFGYRGQLYDWERFQQQALARFETPIVEENNGAIKKP